MKCRRNGQRFADNGVKFGVEEVVCAMWEVKFGAGELLCARWEMKFGAGDYKFCHNGVNSSGNRAKLGA